MMRCVCGLWRDWRLYPLLFGFTDVMRAKTIAITKLRFMRLKLAIQMCRVNKAEIMNERRARTHKIAIYTPSSGFDCIRVSNGLATSIRSPFESGVIDGRTSINYSFKVTD